ncbi:MAG: hypothetical protein ABSA82_09860 [Thermacetogeniaceae bacterium]|jgi:hypothetical protein
MHTYFQKVTPNQDYSLGIVFEDGGAMVYPMVHLLNQLRFRPLKDRDVWTKLEVFSTHLEWSQGAYQVTLNIEEIIPGHAGR